MIQALISYTVMECVLYFLGPLPVLAGEPISVSHQSSSNCKIKLRAIIADLLNCESIYFAPKHEQQQQQQYLYSPCT